MLPFLIAALAASVAVFFVSAIMNTVLTYHQRTYVGLPIAAEDALLKTLRELKVAPNTYMYPAPKTMANVFEDKGWLAKVSSGPIGTIRIAPGLNGPPSMGAQLIQFFVWVFVVSAATLFVRSALHSDVALVTFLVALFGHCGGDISALIWENKKPSTVFIHIFDSAVYAIVTAIVYHFLS